MYIWILAPLVSCLSYILLCAFALQSIGKAETQKQAGRVFVAYLLTAATWSFTSFMLHLNAFPQQALFWNELLTVALVATLLIYFHFIHDYVNRRPRLGLYLGYTGLIVLGLLSFRGYIVKYSYVINGRLYHSLGIALYFIGAFCLVYVIAIILFLIQRYRRAIDPVERNRFMYLVLGWSILVTLTYTNLFPPLDAFPLDHVGNLANAVIIAYAISRYNLLDIKFVVRRGLTYVSLLAALILVYIGAIFLGYKLLASQPALSVVVLATVVALLITVMATPLRLAIQEGVDKLFYRETYSARRRLFGLRDRMSNILDTAELAREILPAVTKALRIAEARLLLQGTDSTDFATQATYPEVKGTSDQELTFKFDNPIVAWLDKKRLPLDTQQVKAIPELKGLWQSEKTALFRSEVGMLYPISSHGKLIGILALGKKEQRKHAYSNEDLELVRSVAVQAGVIIENAQLYSQATFRANRDWLTSLNNHRNFHERLEQEISRSSRFGKVFSLTMIDLDLFKSYNDLFGHLAGDEVLRIVARTIQDSIRNVDLAFRYGGEEFAVILPETRLEDAYRVAERIRKAIETGTSSLPMQVTASLGVASWPIDGVMREELIARADAALYQAKGKGRNQTCLSSEVSRSEIQTGEAELEGRSKALNTVYALAATVDAKDHYTYGHSKKVADYAVAIAREVGLPPQKIALIRSAGLLHDIGKISIPDSVLKKKEPLTEREWLPVKDHPRLGVEILRHIPELGGCLPAVMHHHERYDGSGYPAGLKGTAIPLEARILALADAYEAITSPRHYHEQLPFDQGLSELRRCSGTQFDPELVKVLLRIIEKGGLKPTEAT
ncbi:MAG: diguanylate cyclase [Chloroflexota bacterium]